MDWVRGFKIMLGGTKGSFWGASVVLVAKQVGLQDLNFQILLLHLHIYVIHRMSRKINLKK